VPGSLCFVFLFFLGKKRTNNNASFARYLNCREPPMTFAHHGVWILGMQLCEYVKSVADCSGTNFNYLAFYQCQDRDLQALIIILFFCILVSIFYLLGTTAGT
jgi:hypothetical protein